MIRRKEVILRWMRRSIARRALPLGRAYARLRIKRGERARIDALEEALDTVHREALRAKRTGFQANYTFLNLALFFLVAERDIQALKIDALTHPDRWKRNLSIRQMLLVLHELDLNKAAGQEIQKAMNSYGVSDELQGKVRKALKKVGQVQRRARDTIESLRNHVMAHRDADAVMQYQLIHEINMEESIELVGQFYDSVHDFIQVMPELIRHSGRMDSLLLQIRARRS
jgi:hypothetical protein